MRLAREINTGETVVPRGSPLPWLLLALTVLVALGIFVMARTRLAEEKVHTANALKATDDVMGRLRTTGQALAALKDRATAAEAKRAELEAKLAALEEEKRGLQDKLDAAAKPPRKKK